MQTSLIYFNLEYTTLIWQWDANDNRGEIERQSYISGGSLSGLGGI